MKGRGFRMMVMVLAAVLAATLVPGDAMAEISCARDVTANVFVIDKPLMYNRLGAGNVNGKMYALKRDLVTVADLIINSMNVPALTPLTNITGSGGDGALTPADLAILAGNVDLRGDKRPRPLVLRIRKGDCLTVNLTNLLTDIANPFNPPPAIVTPAGENFTVPLNEQVADRHASFHAAGLQWITGSADDGSWVGTNNPSSIAADSGGTAVYSLYAGKEGVFPVVSHGATIGSDGNMGNVSNGLFGQVIVDPTGAAIYRGQVFEEEYRLAADANLNGSLDAAEKTAGGHPILNYEATYPTGDDPAVGGNGNGVIDGAEVPTVWDLEGKGGLPILNMMRRTGATTYAAPDVEIVHSEINAVVAYGGDDEKVNGDGQFPLSTYPLESQNKRNPTVPNRLEPFRDFASVFHDETANGQAFPGFFVNQPGVGGAPGLGNPVFKYVMAGVKDAFMINYGSGGIGSEIVANRLGVGPMHDCLDCAYEEFFLSSFTVGDPAMTVDTPANFGLEACEPVLNGRGQVGLNNCPAAALGPKANYAIGAEDPANVHHSYTGDFAKIHNTHTGLEQHIFHLHNHQWLFNANDDNANYLDAQGIGPGSGYTYEINFGGSGNRNKSAGDSIFHCHFYPHFAQGMWYHWRHHDVTETGTVLAATPNVPDVTVPNPACVTDPAPTDTTCEDPAANTIPAFVPADPATLTPGTFSVIPIGYHAVQWALAVTTPAAGARAYPDGEIPTGTSIPAVVPLPGKPMAPMPGRATVVAKLGNVPNPLCVAPNLADPTGGTCLDAGNNSVPAFVVGTVGSNAKVIDRDINPGFPFWVAGIEDVVGQRAPTPPLDMANATLVDSLPNLNIPVKDATGATVVTVTDLFGDLLPGQADGFDGGLPRHALQGYSAGGATSANVISPIDFSKVMSVAKPVYYPEEGTDLERVAMAFHSLRNHPTYRIVESGGAFVAENGASVNFVANGSKPVIGAPYHNPCIDDEGKVLLSEDPGSTYNYFSGETLTGMGVHGKSVFTSDNPRIYKGTNMQFDAVLNKVGYHYPQQRIVSLWEDVGPVIAKQKAPEPLVMRLNTFDCAIYHHSNLVPEVYELDDYQVRTPTDIIGQHIHLPKWDLTTADGAANGWNYEDGTLSPGSVRERIEAINAYVTAGGTPAVGTGSNGFIAPTHLEPAAHPYFSSVAAALDGATVGTLPARETFAHAWLGARTTTQRWWADPVVNTSGVDRGLGIIFTHDHYGPSTHQQIGLYATVLTEPAGSMWAHNETGTGLGCDVSVNTTMPPGTTAENTVPCRWDGGPTSWQAMIEPPESAPNDSNVKSETVDPFREFYFEYSDFQHAYEAGVYVGTNQMGLPLQGTAPGNLTQTVGVEAGAPVAPADAFRFAINPPARAQIAPVFPDLVLEVAGGVLPSCPVRPCPQAIDVEDPGILVMNYRHEPVGLRVYDPAKIGPDGLAGMQADGQRGDLAYALQSRTDRAIALLNQHPTAGFTVNGTVFPPPINKAGVKDGDPFTPVPRAMAGDVIRVKMQAGGHEEEHKGTFPGLQWLQGGSGHGRAPNSGWRSTQSGGISEQFTLSIPVFPSVKTVAFNDFPFSVDSGNDGWWSGMWTVLRSYSNNPNNLALLENNDEPLQITNADLFRRRTGRGNQFEDLGACPNTAPVRSYDVTAVLANEVLPNALGATIPTPLEADPFLNAVATQHVGGLRDPATGAIVENLDSDGGTLVYNNRNTTVMGPGTDPLTGLAAIVTHQGPIHDPTAILYVRTEDLVFDTACLAAGTCRTQIGTPVGLQPGAPVEPLVLRAAAGECIEVTLRNALPPLADVNIGTPEVPVIVQNSTAPDLATYSSIQGVVKRDRLGLEGSTTFNSNLFRPSSWVGLTPQLVAVDTGLDSAMVVGGNPANNLVSPRGSRKYHWYAGNLTALNKGKALVGSGKNKKEVVRFELVPTPVELGGSNLLPSDKVKQGAKSLVGALVVEPANSNWTETTQVSDRQTGTGFRSTRAQATVTAPAGAAGSGGTFRDFSLVLTKGLTQYFADGSPVEHMNGEGVGIPEDSQDATGMALNYGIEPMWFRFGILPQAPFGNALTPGSYGGIPNAHQAFSNSLVGGDPVTPVFFADTGQPARIRITNPQGTTRGSTFALHGHNWQRDPYVCPGEWWDGLDGKCKTPDTGSIIDPDTGKPLVGSRAIGKNPVGFTLGGQESWNAPTSFDIVLDSAGGGNERIGDYLFRDQAAFGNASGVWGILRVE